jgi:hypothetical protein
MEEPPDDRSWRGTTLTLGVVGGVILGLAIGNLATGIAIGVAVGAAYGAWGPRPRR